MAPAWNWVRAIARLCPSASLSAVCAACNWSASVCSARSVSETFWNALITVCLYIAVASSNWATAAARFLDQRPPLNSGPSPGAPRL